MRIHIREPSCGFRFAAAVWGELDNFRPLAVPIDDAGPRMFVGSASV